MSGGVKAPPDKAAEQLRVHEHVAERNANVRFTESEVLCTIE